MKDTKGKTLNLPTPDTESGFLSVLPPKGFDSRPSLTSQTLSDVPSDIIIESRIKYGSRWSACKGLLMDYSKSTTIHGIRYLVEVHRPFYEKIYWLVILLISFYFAGSLIWDTYLKWKDTPVILGFDETLVPVHKIPFPTITICPEIKTDTEIFNFSNISRQMWDEIQQNGKFDNIGNMTDEQISQFATTLQICEADVVNRFAKYIPKNILPDVTQTLVDLTITKNLTAPFCKWNGRFYFCDKILNFVPTDEGICYQFNGLNTEDIYRDIRFASYVDEQVVDFNNYFDDLPRLNDITGNWSLERGYVEQGFNAYPQRTVFSSVRNAFFAFLQGFEHNFDYACRSFKQGYRVYLNSPESVPLTTGNYILVPHGDEVIVSVLPQYIVSSESLRDYSPQKRQCFFDDERYLSFFRSYSQSNCQVECLTNYTIKKCGCVKFWMPKPLNVPVCGLANISCYNAAQDELNMMLQNQTMQRTINPDACDCMPSCTSLEYDFEISNARYDLEATLVALREVYEHTDALASRLSVYFKEHQFTAIKRTAVFSFTTLIANCGGIFGLFMGISMLSFIELIYFFSVRLISNLRKRRLVKKKMQQQLATDDQTY